MDKQMDKQMDKHAEAEIVAIEERLRQAMLNSDVAELDALIAPELLFTTHVGQLYSKEADLEAHRSGSFKFTELTPSDRHIQRHPGFAVVSVLMHTVGLYEGTASEANIRFTRVWAPSAAGPLQIVAGHTSTVVDAPV